MANFKVGQKVVCILNGDWADDIGLESQNPTPKKGDIVEIEVINKNGVLGFVGFNFIGSDGTRDCFCPAEFRPLDDSQTEEILSMILAEKENHERVVKLVHNPVFNEPIKVDDYSNRKGQTVLITKISRLCQV